MEQVPLGGAVQEWVEERECEGHEWEEWVDPEQVPVQEEIVYVQNVAQR